MDGGILEVKQGWNMADIFLKFLVFLKNGFYLSYLYSSYIILVGKAEYWPTFEWHSVYFNNFNSSVSKLLA